MSIILRDYQEYAVTQAVKGMRLEGNDLLCLATGAGKSIIIAEIANRLNQDICIFQPNKEIGFQNISKLKQFVPEWEIGVFSATMGSKKVRKYTFATIGSVYQRPELFAHFGLFIIDEAHLVNMKNEDSMFTTFIKHVNRLRQIESLPAVKIIGLTATPYRNMTGYHTSESGQLYSTTTLKLINRVKPEFWSRILVNVGIGDLIRDGYLCPLNYENRSFMKHDEMKMNKSHTEFDLEDFGKTLVKTKKEQVLDCIEDAQKRFKSVLVFCPSVSAANTYAEAVLGSAAVSAKSTPEARDRTIRHFKDGRIQTVFNMGVLTTGFDHPELDCIVMLRPTRSLALWMQMGGRGVRTAEGKEHCTIIDWTNTVGQLGKIETVELRKEQFPEFKHPMWEIFSQTEKGEERWHNRALYSFAVQPKSKSYYAQKAMEKKKYGRRY